MVKQFRFGTFQWFLDRAALVDVVFAVLSKTLVWGEAGNFAHSQKTTGQHRGNKTGRCARANLAQFSRENKRLAAICTFTKRHLGFSLLLKLDANVKAGERFRSRVRRPDSAESERNRYRQQLMFHGRKPRVHERQSCSYRIVTNSRLVFRKSSW